MFGIYATKRADMFANDDDDYNYDDEHTAVLLPSEFKNQYEVRIQCSPSLTRKGRYIEWPWIRPWQQKNLSLRALETKCQFDYRMHWDLNPRLEDKGQAH